MAVSFFCCGFVYLCGGSLTCLAVSFFFCAPPLGAWALLGVVFAMVGVCGLGMAARQDSRA